MNSYPKITIITPSYNQGQYLEQTIVSILSQGYENLEYIIIDGGSSDQSVEIIKKYQNKIAYWISEKDYGQSDAIRKGLEKATGNIFNWINSDDYLEPGSLHTIAEEFNKHPEKKIVCGYTHCFYDEDGTDSHTYRMGIRKTVTDTILNVEMNQPGSFYLMSALKELGGINTSLRYVFDGELWFRFLCKFGLNTIHYTDTMIAHFRLHKTSKSVGEGFFEFYKEFLNIHLFIGSALSLPVPIIDYMKSEQYIDRYVPNEWDFAMLERDLFLQSFADKYKYLLYKDKYYSLARKGLKTALKKQHTKEWKSMAALGLKLAFPDKLINSIRYLKNKK